MRTITLVPVREMNLRDEHWKDADEVKLVIVYSFVLLFNKYVLSTYLLSTLQGLGK